MIRIYLLIALVAIFFWLKKLFNKTGIERKSYIKRSIFVFLAFLVVLLAVLGRLHWIIAGLGMLLAFAVRAFPMILRYAPQLQKIFQLWRQSNGKTSQSRSAQKKSSSLTKEQACRILGVSITASKQEIVDAHRKLMLKNHPDRGGTDYMAAQINQAKERLLDK